MSREELKHRMDQMTPPDFNKEDLWGKIESEKKKKWGFAWFFMVFGLGLVAIVSTWAMRDSYGPQELELLSSQENTVYENQKLITQKELINAQSTVVETEEPNKENPRATQPINKVDQLEIKETQVSRNSEPVHSISKTSIEKNGANMDNENKLVTIKSDDRRENLIDTKERQIIGAEKSVEIALGTEPYNEVLEVGNTDEIRKLEEILGVGNKDLRELEGVLAYDALPSIVSFLSVDINSINGHIISAPIKINSKNSFAANNSIQLYIGVGTDNQRFSNDSKGQLRDFFETDLESRILELKLEHQFSRHLYSTVGIGFTQTQSNLQATKETSIWRFINASQSVDAWTSSEYSYYNEYYRADASISLGYIMNLGRNWQLKPSLGVGFNIFSRQKGDILSSELEFVNLEDQSEYRTSTGLLGIAGLGIEKTLNNNYRFGLKIEAQTKRDLIQSHDYSHIIQPLSVGVYIANSF